MIHEWKEPIFCCYLLVYSSILRNIFIKTFNKAQKEMIKSLNWFPNKPSRHNSFQSILSVFVSHIPFHCNETKKVRNIFTDNNSSQVVDEWHLQISILFISAQWISSSFLFLLIAFKVVFARLRNHSHLSVSSIVDIITANYGPLHNCWDFQTPCFEHFGFFA